MSEKSFIEQYPFSIAAWKQSEDYKKINIEFISSGEEEIFYDFQAAAYAYWYSDKVNKELQTKLDETIEVMKRR